MSAGHSTPAADARASAARVPKRDEDGRVEIGSEWITIRRNICGIAARVNVPTRSYRGIALRAARDGNPFELALSHADANLEVVIARTNDDSDLIALWRSYGRLLALPLLAEDARGRLQAMEARGDELPFPRRHGSPLKNRRPRFLARRKVGRADGSDFAPAA
jgi:hypothetical protein